MRYVYLSLLSLLFSFHLHGQQSSFVFKSGLGTYLMTDLKANQDEILDQIPVDARKVDEFPPYLNFGIEGMTSFKNDLSIGFLFDFQSTGGRISYADFSGRIGIDHRISAIGLGIAVHKAFRETEKFIVMGNLEGSGLFTKMVIESNSEIGTVSSSEELEFEAISPALGGNIVFRRLLNNFFIQVSGGFQYDIGGKVKLDNSEGVLLTPEGAPARTQWSGGRIEIGIGYTFSQK